jgi:transcriptional regulator with XRE-family HTH domain
MPAPVGVLQELDRYLISEKLRGLRLRKKISLADLGKHAELSPALLSKLERGKLIPTLPTLLRIALVFGVSLDYFFSDEKKKHFVYVTRQGERLRMSEITNSSTYDLEYLIQNASDRKVVGYVAEFRAEDAKSARFHSHLGVELIYVLTGTLGLRIGADDYALEGGDAIYFDSNARHGYWRTSSSPCRALIVTSSPEHEAGERRLNSITNASVALRDNKIKPYFAGAARTGS